MASGSPDRTDLSEPSPSASGSYSHRVKGKQKQGSLHGIDPSTSTAPSRSTQPLQYAQQVHVSLTPEDDPFDILQYNPANYRDRGQIEAHQSEIRRCLLHGAASPSGVEADAHSGMDMSDQDISSNQDVQDERHCMSSQPESPLLKQGTPLPTIVFMPSEAANRHRSGPNRPFEALKRLHHSPEIVFLMTKFLRLDDVINLYAVSKDFRELANSRFTGLIQILARWKAPESGEIFNWAFYKPLCIKDPGFRPHPRLENECRLVPSFRWLRFIYHREKVVQEIMAHMNEAGVRIPKAASKTLKKLWLLMEIPDTNRRIAFMQSRWTDRDLLFAQMFVIKLDMRFCDPIDGKGQNKIRKMLLAQKSMTVILDVLARRALLSQFDCMKMYIRWKWVPSPAHRRHPIFGIPPNEVGRLQYEGWGRGYPRKLVPLESLVIKEACRRDLGLEDDLVDMFQWGYVNSHTGDSLETPKVPMRPWRLEDEYDSSEDDDDGPEMYFINDHAPVGEQRGEIFGVD